MADGTQFRWRTFAPWGSLLCGVLAALLTFAFMIHLDFGQSRRNDPWVGWYFFAAAPTSLLGVVLGVVGEEPPRGLGLVLSGCALLYVLVGAITW